MGKADKEVCATRKRIEHDHQCLRLDLSNNLHGDIATCSGDFSHRPRRQAIDLTSKQSSRHHGLAVADMAGWCAPDQGSRTRVRRSSRTIQYDRLARSKCGLVLPYRPGTALAWPTPSRPGPARRRISVNRHDSYWTAAISIPQP